MKRLIIGSILLIFCAMPSFAQRNTISAGMLIRNTEVIKKERQKKGFKTIDFKKGYQQEVSFAWSWAANYYDVIHHINLNYIGGFRFNHHLFVGGGTGLDFGAGYTFKPYVIENHNNIFHSPTASHTEYYMQYDLPIQKVSIPLYAHFKVYFMKTRLAPFLAFSGGVRFSAPKKLEVYENDAKYSYDIKFGDYIRTEKYGAVTGMFEVLPGVSYQLNDKYTCNFQIGYATRSGHRWNGSYWNGDYNTIRRTWYHGMTMRLGFVF